MAKKIAIENMESTCEEVCTLLRALSHPQRLMVLCHLTEGEKTVSELQELCDISQSQLSQFLTRMKAEGLLTSRKEGAFQIYSIADKRVSRLIVSIEGLFCATN
jgi:DNA-binding transcriptional ArsR family regulator